MSKPLLTIRVRKGDLGRALKRFKNMVNESGHIKELKQRKTYIKPKTKRRLQKQQAIRENQRLLKELRKDDKHQ